MVHRGRSEHDVLVVATANCIWCRSEIRLGIVTTGGVRWHFACWRERQALMRHAAEELARCMT
jgi:hypothetical protein